VPEPPDELTAGINDPDRAGFWLVPPWPRQAEYHEVVMHFLRFWPRPNASTQQMLTFFEQLEAALEVASTASMVHPTDRHWQKEMRDCLARCITSYREQRLVERSGKRPRPAGIARRALTYAS
jgi:hypothetical protein